MLWPRLIIGWFQIIKIGEDQEKCLVSRKVKKDMTDIFSIVYIRDSTVMDFVVVKFSLKLHVYGFRFLVAYH